MAPTAYTIKWRYKNTTNWYYWQCEYSLTEANTIKNNVSIANMNHDYEVVGVIKNSGKISYCD